MNLMQKLACEPTGIRKVGFLPLVKFEEEMTAHHGTTPNGYFQDEYRLRATFEINFTANRAQYQEAKKQAERVFAQRVFGQILHLVEECSHAAYNQDQDAIFSALSAIRKEILG